MSKRTHKNKVSRQVEKDIVQLPEGAFVKNASNKEETETALSPNDVNLSQDVSKYRKRAIHDNWAKYEADLHDVDDLENEENQLQSNFEFLLESSSGASNFFRLAAEKEWEKEMADTDTNLFHLDLKMLSDGLACVPFYERIGVNPALLTDADKERCDQKAEENWIKYQPIYHEIQNQRKSKATDKVPSSKSPDLCLDKPDEVLLRLTLEEACDDDVALKSPVMGTKSPELAGNSSRPNVTKDITERGKHVGDDLEDWLDSVLGD